MVGFLLGWFYSAGVSRLRGYLNMTGKP